MGKNGQNVLFDCNCSNVFWHQFWGENSVIHWVASTSKYCAPCDFFVAAKVQGKRAILSDTLSVQ